MRIASTTGVLHWLLTDHLGSTSLTLTAGGTREGEQRYMPFGLDRYQDGTLYTDYRYTGQRVENDTDLYFYSSRWYDPVVGRFIQPDTIVPEPGNPQSLNRYTYVSNNPVKYTDPSGHWGPDVHLTKTAFWTAQTMAEVAAQQFALETALGIETLPESIAKASVLVDTKLWPQGFVDLVLHIGDFEYSAERPNRSLGGAKPEQYYHYPSMAEAEGRLEAAIVGKDPTAFGEALHSFQDYYSHTANGYTAVAGDIGSLSTNCPECFADVPSYGELFKRANLNGHDGATVNPDIYDLSKWNAREMTDRSKWYILRFVLYYYYDMSYDEYMESTASASSDE